MDSRLLDRSDEILDSDLGDLNGYRQILGHPRPLEYLDPTGGPAAPRMKATPSPARQVLVGNMVATQRPSDRMQESRSSLSVKIEELFTWTAV